MSDDLVKRLRAVLWSVNGEPNANGNVSETACSEAADRIEQLTAELADAVQGLEKCQEELDAYSRQEYPLDHTVHERYRQRDYDANPARITLAALKGERHD